METTPVPGSASKWLSMASRAQPARWFTGQFLPVGKGEESRMAMHYAKLVQGARQGQVFKFADKPICQCLSLPKSFPTSLR